MERSLKSQSFLANPVLLVLESMRKILISSQSREEINLLQSLGLTINQARVYLSLIEHRNSATARDLSRVSGLAVCDIYRVVPELTNLGLLEVMVASPKQFRATPPKDAIEILCRQREKEVEEVKNKAKTFVADLPIQENKTPEGSKIVLIPGGHRAIQFGLSKLLNTRERLDAIQTNKLFSSFINSTSGELHRLLKRVRMRFIIESAKGIKKTDQDLAWIIGNPNFEVRFIEGEIQACVLLNDNTDAFINSSMDTINTPSYWSNNPCVVAIVRSYFETTWDKSSNYSDQRTNSREIVNP
jgi:sugar-specific transcriptional regulator TrmB